MKSIKRLFAAIIVSAACLSASSCGFSGSGSYYYGAGNTAGSGTKAEFSGDTVTGEGYTFSADTEKWITVDKYKALLKGMGHTYNAYADEMRQACDGVLYFVDENIRADIEQKYSAYDVPHLIIGTPDRSDGYKDITIADMADDAVKGLSGLYATIDGTELLEDESGLVEIDGRQYLKVVINVFYNDGEITIKRISYQTIENSVMYTLTFSSTEETSERLESEYESVVDSMRFE